MSGSTTPQIEQRVDAFFTSIAATFEAWLNRRRFEHTRHAYRGDVMAFVKFRKISWPRDAAELLRTSIFGRPGLQS